MRTQVTDAYMRYYGGGVCGGVWGVGVGWGGGGDGGLNAFDIDMSWCRVFNARLSSREFNRTSAIIYKYM